MVKSHDSYKERLAELQQRTKGFVIGGGGLGAFKAYEVEVAWDSVKCPVCSNAMELTLFTNNDLPYGVTEYYTLRFTCPRCFSVFETKTYELIFPKK